MQSSLPDRIQSLLSPTAYPHAPKDVELRQTHISYVFLAGDLVYKLKKPLDLGFLDFTTLEKRRHYCEEEVSLNRRLCDETYLDVVPVVETSDGIRIDTEGDAVDYAVKMRRLPEEGMMTALLERDAITSDQLRNLASTIAAFHDSSESNDKIVDLGGFETVKVNWKENFEQTRSYIGRTISQEQFDSIRTFIEREVSESKELFQLREREGRIHDCHGDMRSDAVCFVDHGVCIFDCIEFNERFRYSDVASDIAFLAMDLEYRGHLQISDELMGFYIGATADSTLPLLLPFYKCYRAYVRGKVDGFQLDQQEIDDTQKQAVASGAQRYFDLASRYATQASAPTLIIMCGLTGTGKSHLANALAARLGAAIYSSDIVRKALLGLEAHERRWEPFGAGIYNQETTREVYDALVANAESWLEQGKSVILDASYLRREERKTVRGLAKEMAARFLVVETLVDEEAIRERLAARGESQSASDGRWEIYEAQTTVREPVDELDDSEHLTVETSLPLAEQIEAVVQHRGL